MVIEILYNNKFYIYLLGATCLDLRRYQGFSKIIFWKQ